MGRGCTANDTSTLDGHVSRTWASIWGPVSGFTTSTSWANPARSASPARRSITASPPGPIGASGFDAAVATGAAGGEDDERGHEGQRSTALDQVIPAPNPVSSSTSPGAIRPSSKASTSASGIEALEVLP